MTDALQQQEELQQRYVLPLTAYDQGQAFFNAFLRGKLGAAGRALFSPETMTPDELKSALQQYVKTLPEKRTVAGKSIDFATGVLTNPIFLVGLMLAQTSAPLAASALKKVAPKFYARGKVGWFRKFFGTAEGVFGPRVANLWAEIEQSKDKFLHQVSDSGEPIGWEARFASVITKGTKMLGRPPNAEEEMAIGTYLSGGHVHGIWQQGAAMLRDGPLSSSIAKLTGKRLPRAVFKGPELDAFLDSKPGLRFIATESRNLLNSFWKDYIEKLPPEHYAALKKALMKRGVENPLQFMQDQRFYLPYRVKYEDPMAGTLGTIFNPEQMERSALEQLDSIASGHLFHRGYRLLPSEETLEAMKRIGVTDDWGAGVIRNLRETEIKHMARAFRRFTTHSYGSLDDTKAWESITKHFDIRPWHAKELSTRLLRLRALGFQGEALEKEVLGMAEAFEGGLGRYDTAVTRVLTGYFRSMAPQHAFVVEGLGKQVKLAKLDVSPELHPLFDEDTLMLMGRRTRWQMERAHNWAAKKQGWLDSLKTGWGKSLTKMGAPGRKVHKWLVDLLSDPRASMTPSAVSANAAGYFYLSTMGFNPGPVLKNFLQPIITTWGIAGPGAAMKALTSIAPKYVQFMKLRASGVGMDVALQRAFPGFASTRLSAQPLSDIALSGTLASPGAPSSWAGKGWQKFSRAAMKFFGESELWNRVYSYEVGDVWARSTLPMAERSAKNIHEVASQLVRMTQFPGGHLGVPYGLRKAPHLFRQFLHFPTRFMGMLSQSTRLGTVGQEFDSSLMGKLTGRNLRGVGRVMMYSTGLYEAAKAAGVNLAPGLMFGALPTPVWENAPFFPMPAVPPVFTVVGESAKAVLSGDYSRMGTVAALGVPGGVMGRRLLKNLSPKYAKYDQRLPDGRIPLFNEQGGYMGAYSPLQIFGRTIGMRGMDDETEKFFMGYLRRQRDQIREYRRSYVEATSQNDTEKAESIQREFKQRYPELGPIVVKRSDITAIEERKTVARLMRLVKGFPKEYKGQFIDMARGAMAQSTMTRLQYNPESLQYLIQSQNQTPLAPPQPQFLNPTGAGGGF